MTKLYNENVKNTNFLAKLTDINNQESGVILFGASTLRMSSCLPNVLPLFSARFPKVEIRITDSNSLLLEQFVSNGDLDLAITMSTDEPNILKTHLMYDQIYLCISNELLKKYYDNRIEELKEKSINGANLKDFSKIPFCILNNRLGQSIQKCFDEAGFSPKIYTTSSYIQISTSIGLQGLAACFATRTSLLNLKGNIPKDINIFPLLYKKNPLREEIFIIQRKDKYTTMYTQHFINLIKEYFYDIEKLSIKQLINSNY